MGEVDEVTKRIFEALDVVPRVLSGADRWACRDRGIEIKTPEQIDEMRRAGLVVGETLELLRAAVRPGITTGELDAIAEDNIRSPGRRPSFLGYHAVPRQHLRVGQRRGRARHPR